MSVCLSQAELEELTGYPRPSAQARELDHLGIPYQRRRNGSLIVLRAHVEPHARTAGEPELRFGR